MKIGCFGIALLAVGALVAADPALARAKHKYRAGPRVLTECRPEPARPWFNPFEFRPAPRPNGCAAPVFQYGEYVGQDPDPYIRQQLLRDPTTGYPGYLFAR